MTMSFDVQENNDLERMNSWYRGHLSNSYRNLSKEVWCKRFECFLSKKDETLDDLEKRFDRLIEYLKENDMDIKEKDQISKFANGLSAEWDDCLKNLRKNDDGSQMSLYKFIKKLKDHDYENYQKKRELLDKIKINLEDLSLEVIKEINKRINFCLGTKRKSVYDMKRGCYIDDNRNPLDLVTIFGAGTYKIEKEQVPKVEESVKSVCFKCDNFKTDNDKLVKDAESLALEIKKLREEKQADEKQILIIQESCEKLKAENDKLLGGLDSLTFENRKLKENIKVFENKQKSSEDEDFWIKLENKNLKASESKFQEQIKILENEKTVLEILKNENENSIKSHLERISQLESEAENSRNRIDELEKKLIGFVTSSDKLNIPCPKPINSVPVSNKVEGCDGKSDDKKVKIEKQKLILNLKEKSQKSVLQSTEKGECSKQKPLKKKVEQKQKDSKKSSDRSSNHSAQKLNSSDLRKEYHQAKQCFDLSVWTKNGDRYDNRMCYSCGYHGHIAVNCRYWRYETRRCFNCNIKGHIARECPRRSNERLRANSQKSAKIPVKVKPQEQKVLKPKVQEQSTPEKKVKLSQGQKDRLRKKRKKAREYLERILSSGSPNKKIESSDESIPSAAKTSKTNSSDTNLRTEQRGKKKEKVGDESDRSKSDKPSSGNDSGSLKPEELLVEVKKENSGLAMDDANFPPLLNKNSKSPKDRQAWVNLFK
ncbi:putative transcription factor interactor and regulator CCHC(Zn) family [Helianthus annuus]|nr:putative transcription factor interactor and regulator CCHC(Zn) family [Helianthus annuus]